MAAEPTDDAEPVYDLGRPHSSDEPAGEDTAALMNLDAVRDAAQRITGMDRSILDAYSKIMPRLGSTYIPDEFVVPRGPMWDVAESTRQQAEQLAEWTSAMDEQREEDARKEAERDAREERALKVAEDSLAEARRSRIIAAWSVAVALVALIVTVITIFVV